MKMKKLLLHVFPATFAETGGNGDTTIGSLQFSYPDRSIRNRTPADSPTGRQLPFLSSKELISR